MRVAISSIVGNVWRKQAVDVAENIANEQGAHDAQHTLGCDITYSPTGEDWLYLTAVIDWVSRLIVGWLISEILDSRLCIQVLQLAIHCRKPPSDMIFHSNQGSQYSNQAFRHILTEAKRYIAKVRRENVLTMLSQSVFSQFKNRETKHLSFRMQKQALLCGAEYIEDFQTALGNRSP